VPGDLLPQRRPSLRLAVLLIYNLAGPLATPLRRVKHWLKVRKPGEPAALRIVEEGPDSLREVSN